MDKAINAWEIEKKSFAGNPEIYLEIAVAGHDPKSLGVLRFEVIDIYIDG